MTKSESIQNLAVALVKFQSEVGTVTKDASNPFFKSKYSTLAAVIETTQQPLAKHGLAVVQFPSRADNNGISLTTILIHTSGEFIEDSYTMYPVDNKPQTIGSCISYMRRYGMQSVLRIASDDDDDGNHASGQGKKKGSLPAYPTNTDDIPF